VICYVPELLTTKLDNGTGVVEWNYVYLLHLYYDLPSPKGASLNTAVSVLPNFRHELPSLAACKTNAVNLSQV